MLLVWVRGGGWRGEWVRVLQGIYVDTGALGWRDSTGNNSQKAGNRTQTHWTLPTTGRWLPLLFPRTLSPTPPSLSGETIAAK